MTIKEIEEEIIEEFELFDDWMQKYEHLIELGKDLPLIDEAHRIDDNLIKGCQSKVWLWGKRENGVIDLSADSNAIITKGIIALLVRIFNGQPAEKIVTADLSFITSIGLQEHLSPSRANGLVEMVKQIKVLALKYTS